MRAHDHGFADRVRVFEDRLGQVDCRTLAVLAQAAYFCWFEQEYERDFLEVCRAIGSGVPTSLYLCGQVTPQRWTALHEYVVAVQRWLGDERPCPEVMDKMKVSLISQWLGEPAAAKSALAELFLHGFIHGLRYGTSLSVLSGDTEHAVEQLYDDYSSWYSRVMDGRPYGDREHGVAAEECKQRALHEMQTNEEDARELIDWILKDSQPACMHRYTRYQDIKLASIGALKWRGALPVADVPKDAACRYLDEGTAAVNAWLCDEPRSGDLAAALYEALGTPTETKRSIVRSCFLPSKDDLSTCFSAWLSEQAQEVGSLVGSCQR